jgi:hypothetical protein
MLLKPVAITQKSHSLLFGGNVKIHLPIRCAELGEGNKPVIGMSVTTTVKFVLISGFGKTLNTSGA